MINKTSYEIYYRYETWWRHYGCYEADRDHYHKVLQMMPHFDKFLAMKALAPLRYTIWYACREICRLVWTVLVFLFFKLAGILGLGTILHWF